MRLRDQVALTLPSFFLRLTLGIIFLWAGSGKLMGTIRVAGDDAARLANLSIALSEPTTNTPADQQPPIDVHLPDSDSDSDSNSDSAPVDATPSEVDTPISTQPTEDALEEMGNQIIDQLNQMIDQGTEEGTEYGTTETPVAPPETAGFESTQLLSVQLATPRYSASDFPDSMEADRLYSIALLISKSADPGLTADSLPIDPTIPSMLANNPWPKVLAWAAAVTEIAAGIFLIFGLLTRLSALATFSIMLVAIWMTQIGPAAIQHSDSLLGFIPHKGDPWAPESYIHLFWQLSLASMSAAVFFLGSGAIGVDRLLFKPSYRDPYLHGDPKASKGNKGGSSTQADRSAFDRTPNPTP